MRPENTGQKKRVFWHILRCDKCIVLVFYKKKLEKYKKIYNAIKVHRVLYIYLPFIFSFIIQNYLSGCSGHFRKRNWLPRKSLATNKITYSNCYSFLITIWRQRVYVEQFIFWMKNTLRAVIFASAKIKNFININFCKLMVQ